MLKRSKWLAGLLMTCYLSSCATNSNLRPARTLEKGKFDFGAGAATNVIVVSPVLTTAYGITDDVDVELKYESGALLGSGRYQITKSENAGIDTVVSLQGGYGSLFKGTAWMVSPAIAAGKRLGDFEPYVSYKFQFGRWDTSYRIFERTEELRENATAHFLKIGSRYYVPNTRLFLGMEFGAAVWKLSEYGITPEAAALIGVRF